MSFAGPSNKRAPPKDDASIGPDAKKAKKVHPFFSKTPTVPLNSDFMWQRSLGKKSTCLFGLNLTPTASTHVAAFDLDGTLIKSSFGKSRSKGKVGGSLAFEWWNSVVPKKIRDLHAEGYSIVIISNQALKPGAISIWKEKIQSFATALSDVPFYLFAATAKDEYRKPMPGMWTELARMFGEANISIDKKKSFFVGDAAGRIYGPKSKDFASTDRKWALNLELPFYTPEEYFLGLPPHADYVLDGFSVSSLPELPLLLPTSTPLLPHPPTPEIVCFVGYPSLGKTTFYRRHFAPAGYVHVNQDTLGSRPKCIKATAEALSDGKSVVIDNTNRSTGIRKSYIDLARRQGVPIRCLHFNGSKELAWHNNIYRALNRPNSDAETARELLPAMAFSSFASDFEPPSESEGFSEIRLVNWVFEGTEEERRYWSMWLQL